MLSHSKQLDIALLAIIVILSGALTWQSTRPPSVPAAPQTAEQEQQEVPAANPDRTTAASSGLYNAPTPSGYSLGAAMLMVPEPENAFWGAEVSDGVYFVWTGEVDQVDHGVYVGYTVDLNSSKVTESVRREGLGRIRPSRTGAPDGLLGLNWEECYEGCQQMNDYFDLATGKLLYTTQWSPTVGGSASLMVNDRKIDIALDPKDGCGYNENDIGKLVMVKGFIVDGRAVPFAAPISLRCESGYGGPSYPPFVSFVVEKAPVGLRAVLQDRNYVFGLSIPLSPLDLSKANASTR